MEFRSALSTRVPLFVRNRYNPTISYIVPKYLQPIGVLDEIYNQPRLLPVGCISGTSTFVTGGAMEAIYIRSEPLLNPHHLRPGACSFQPMQSKHKLNSELHLYNIPCHVKKSKYFATCFKFNDRFTYDPLNPTTPIRGRPLGPPDAILVCEGMYFNVHCAILSAHSKKFKAMFDNIMREPQWKLRIDDISSKTLALLIRHMYTGLVPLKIEVELLAAAHLYSNDNLKEVCETDMSQYIRVDSAEVMLKDARTYKALRLEKHIIRFMKSVKL